MSKNLTLKGAAFGALVALSISAVAPASAAGLADTTFVSLAPTSGASYNVLAEADATFSLTANEASSIAAAGRNVKFLVTDADSATEPTIASTGLATEEYDIVTADTAARAADGKVTIAAASGIPTSLKSGDVIYLGTALEMGTNDVTPGFYSLTADATATSLVFQTSVLSDAFTANASATPASSKVYFVHKARAADKSYVVNSGIATSSTDETLVLSVSGTTTRSATVTAWVDANANDLIDSTEYVSPTRTVTWNKASEVTPTVTFTPVLVGDATATAKVTTTPSLNWKQIGNASLTANTWFVVDFTRQGRIDTLANSTESWNDTDAVWTVTRVLNNTATNTPWTATIPSDIAAAGVSKLAKAGKTVTVTTTAAHGFKAFDHITVATTAANTAYEAAADTVITSASDYTFTYAVASNTTDIAATTTIPSGFAVTAGNFGYATSGEYTATVKVGSTPTKIGATASTSSKAGVAASVANVAKTSSDVNSSFAVRKAYKGDVVVTTTVKDADAVVVGAGVPVSIAITETSSGVVVVNGVTVTSTKTIEAVTNAAGQVVITTTNSSAVAGETVQLAVSSQGFSDTDTLTWAAAQYKLVDTADVNTASANVARVIAKNGSVSLNVEVTDQFLQPLTAEARVQVTLGGTRWSSVSSQAMTNGKATVVITDSPVAIATLNPTATLLVQTKNTAGSWVTADTNADVVTDFLRGNGDLDDRAITFNVLSANGSKVVLNADAVGSADLTVPVASEATAATDLRANATAVDFGSTTDVTATITGKVVDALTEAAVDGHTVTVSGNSAILFRVGAKSAFGSLSFVSGANAEFSIDAFSNKALKDSVVTITSNGASKTVKLNFTALAAKSMTVTAPATAKSGNVVNVTATLLDKWGNVSTTAGTITFTSGNLGYLTNDAAVTVVSGKANVKLVLGTSEKGITSVAATASDLDDADGEDVTVSKEILVSITASIVKPAKGATATVKNVKGATIKVVRGSKSISKVATSSSQKVVLKSGTGKVNVYVNGVKVASK